LIEFGEQGVISDEMAVEAPEEEGTSADEQIKEAMRTAVLAAFDDESLDTKATLSKIRDILKAHEKITSNDQPEESPEESEEKEEKMTEAIKKKLATLEAKTMLLESGREATDVQVAAVAAVSEEERKTLVESWPVKQIQQTGNGRKKPERSAPLRESKQPTSASDRRWTKMLEKARSK
jgi:hypothetical protein